MISRTHLHTRSQDSITRLPLSRSKYFIMFLDDQRDTPWLITNSPSEKSRLLLHTSLAKVIIRLIHSRMYQIPFMIDILTLPLNETNRWSAKYIPPSSFLSIYWSKPSNHSSFMFSTLSLSLSRLPVSSS